MRPVSNCAHMRLVCAFLFSIGPAFALIDNARISIPDRNPVSLRGLWRFDSGGESKFLRVEKEWRLQGVKQTRVGNFELDIEIPQNLRTGDFAIILPPVSAALKIYVNGVLAAEKGIVRADLHYPKTSSEAFSWYLIKSELLSASAVQKLRLQITGFQGGGGMFGNAHIFFGGISEIRQKFISIVLGTSFLAAAIFMIAIFHFALVRDKYYRRANLHYVLLSFAMSCHILGMNGLGYYIFDSFLLNATMIHVIIAVFPFTLIGFSRRYFRLKFPMIRNASYVFAVVMALILLSCALFPAIIPTYLEYGLPTGVAAMGFSIVFAIYAALRGLMQKTDGALLVLTGFVVYGLTIVNDVAFYFSYRVPVTLAEVGFLFAVICVAVALAGRLQSAAQEKDELREWKKEISLAAQIQRSAMPNRSLQTECLQINTLFKPMKIIGGDFFGFHQISERITGILIADVSGHGIAAALMVNTIKSVFMQQQTHANEPALLMKNMNAGLFPHLKDQFVTAAYCIVDHDARKVRIAQAGHPPIYMLKHDKKTLEKFKPKGRFLGFDADLTYDSIEIDIDDYCRIFLYSDGVIEAGAINGVPYSVTRLEEFLLESSELSGRNLLLALESDIEKQTQTLMNTDDDSSCVVVDLFAA
jgi:serine phosphatase RsbU (regulator of sigma subunit)